ncbi:MAG: transposase, partial [Planctomycetes bacterium]|nr:transposase [Planctomycetota bacterium]
HIHIACELSRTMTISKLMEEIKKTSSAWIKKQDAAFGSFAWQAGYGAFSLGQSQLADLINYIDNQQTHHQKKTFKEELQVILSQYKVKYDDQYLWD